MSKDQNNTVQEIVEELADEIQTRHTELKEVQNIGESGWFYFVHIRLDKLIPMIEEALQKAFTAGMEVERERIEDEFKKLIPPHGLSLEDGVWLKRIMNKVFRHLTPKEQ